MKTFKIKWRGTITRDIGIDEFSAATEPEVRDLFYAKHGSRREIIATLEIEKPMTEHTPLPVAGYTTQNEKNIQAVNGHKQIEENILQIMDAYKENPDIDQRWLAIARTDLEKSFMALNRSIFKPQRII